MPERVAVGKPRQPKTIWHFLLPDGGMANYTDKVIRNMAKKETAAIREWRQSFIKPFKQGEIETLIRLSGAVDKLWQRHVEQCRQVRELTRDAYSFFGYDDGTRHKHHLTTKEKDDIYNKELLSENVPNSSPFRRLKLVMDYWCALWFWPIQQADKLPSRDEFLMDLTLILEGTLYEAVTATGEQLQLIPDNRPTQADLDFTNEFGYVNVDALCDDEDGIARLALVRDLSTQHHFHHWELVFADIFADHCGFDLNVGNPPWIRIEWNEGGILGDYDPLFVLRKYSAAQMATMREDAIEKKDIRNEYLDEYKAFEGIQNYFNAVQNYPILKGIQSNLFKCFLPQAWYIGTDHGVSGFLHPEGVYDDPQGGILRESIYHRLKYHFQFQNGLNLFPEVAHRERFSINIYSNVNSSGFDHISNLFHTSTIDASYQHNGQGICGGIKNNENDWNLEGHKDRIIRVTTETMQLFARLYDETATRPDHARLPVAHSRHIVEVLKKISAQPRRLADIEDEYLSTAMWDETNSVKVSKIIKRNTQFVDNPKSLIYSGPHLYVGNPLSKTPRSVCTEKSHYDVLDLLNLSSDYYPRTNYIPTQDIATYKTKIPKVSWEKTVSITDYYRLVSRYMLAQPNERTLISCIISKHLGHISTCLSIAFKNTLSMVNMAGLFFSLPFDFFVKTTGRGAIPGLISSIPFPENDQCIIFRALTLNCLTTHYTELWEECWDEAFKKERWTKDDPRLGDSRFADLTPKWQHNCALRTDYERRQALVEIDVLAAMALGLTLDELCTIYRIQFPVLRQNENDTWYDQNGRIVFTVSKGLPGVGFSRPEWNDIKNMQSGTVSRTITDDTLPGGPRERIITYTAPFDRCNREADYATAWAAFEKRGMKL